MILWKNLFIHISTLYFFLFLLNISKAGHPISFCLQYLQAKVPLTNAVPPKNKTIRTTIKESTKIEKLSTNNIIPPIRGSITTKKSGIIWTIEISLSANFLISPFLLIEGQSCFFPDRRFYRNTSSFYNS